MKNLKMRSRTPEQNAFTLIELLVVLTVLAVLAGVSFAAVTKNTLEIQRLQCANNLKRMTQAMTLFCTDTDHGFSYDYSSALWIAPLTNYDSHFLQSMICPSTKSPTADHNPGTANIQWSWSIDVSGSYGLNGWFYYNDSISPADYHFKNLSFVQKPALTPVFTDAIWIDFWPLKGDHATPNLYTGYYSGGASATGMGRVLIARHGGIDPSLAPSNVNLVKPLPPSAAINMGFVDGHIETVKLQRLWTFYWHVNWSPSGRP